MNIQKLLETTPQNLAETQLEAVKKFAVDRLREMAKHIQSGDVKKARDMLFHSPAGDGMGLNSYCISFEDMFPKMPPARDHEQRLDMGDVIDLIEELSNHKKGN